MNLDTSFSARVTWFVETGSKQALSIHELLSMPVHDHDCVCCYFLMVSSIYSHPWGLLGPQKTEECSRTSFKCNIRQAVYSEDCCNILSSMLKGYVKPSCQLCVQHWGSCWGRWTTSCACCDCGHLWLSGSRVYTSRWVWPTWWHAETWFTPDPGSCVVHLYRVAI